MKSPKNCEGIEEIREGIDQIDYQIMKLYRERYEYVKEIVKYKTDETSVIAETRQGEVIAHRRSWATELGLDPDLFEEIFWKLIRHNVQKELELLRNK